MAKRRGLGRGLDALLGSSMAAGDPALAGSGGSLRELAVDRLRRGRFQPRSRIDEESLAELARSIRAQGVVQPIVVRPVAATGDDTGGEEVFEIVAGERRWRAAQAAGLATIPAVVRVVEDDGALAMALIENIQREDLNPIEEAAALSRLVEEFGLTHQAAADAVGRSRASVSNLLRLLELNAEVRRLLEEGALEMGHGRALLGLSGEAQSRAAREVAAKGLSARQTEQLVRRMRARPDAGGGAVSAGAPSRRDPDVERLERELSERIGAPVRVQHDGRGRGSLTVRFSSLEEFEGILERIR